MGGDFIVSLSWLSSEVDISNGYEKNGMFFLPFINSPVNYQLAYFGSKLKKDDKNYSIERILCSILQTSSEMYVKKVNLRKILSLGASGT